MSVKKVSAAKPADEGLPTFEVAIKRLETIVTEMEGGKLNLEDMIGRFEEGQRLAEFCTTKLNEVERRIEMLVKKGDKVEAVPFADEVDPEEDAPSGKSGRPDDELF